jgi:hypothetical protein
MFGEFRYRAHHLSDRVHYTIESAYLHTGALLMLLGIAVFYLVLLAAK